MRWPNQLGENVRTDVCLNTCDIMPTLLSLMGLPIPVEAEGMDLSPAARGEVGPEPEAAFLQGTGATAKWEDGHEWRGMRSKQYTYAIYRIDRKELLFDNIADPYQMNNLAEDPDYSDVLQRFRGLLEEKMKQVGDTFESCTWYRDNWTEDRIILRTATVNQ